MLRVVNVHCIKIFIIRIHGVIIFAFGIKKLTECTAVTNTLNFTVAWHKRIIFS